MGYAIDKHFSTDTVDSIASVIVTTVAQAGVEGIKDSGRAAVESGKKKRGNKPKYPTHEVRIHAFGAM